jgi:hypothetical protein
MSLYRGYFGVRGTDPIGALSRRAGDDTLQSAKENALGLRILWEYLTMANRSWNDLTPFIPDALQYKWSNHPDSIIVFNNREIKPRIDELINDFDECKSREGSFEGVKTRILLDRDGGSILEYFLGETSLHWRVEVAKPWFGLANCNCSLSVTWTFWIDDPIDANSFNELVKNGKARFDGTDILNDIINGAEGIADLVIDKLGRGWVPFKAQTYKSFYVCCDEKKEPVKERFPDGSTMDGGTWRPPVGPRYKW